MKTVRLINSEKAKKIIKQRDAIVARISSFLEDIQFRMAVKVGLSAALSFFFGVSLSHVFDRPDDLVSATWTVITAIVVVQANLGGTYQAAWMRFLGTTVGSLIGCVSTIFLGANTFSIGLSVFGTIAACSFLNLKDSMRIASMSVAVLMVFWWENSIISPWTFVFFRLMDSCIGILTAVTVTHIVWPTQATKRVRMNIVTILRNMRQLLQSVAVLDPANPESIKKIKNRMSKIVELLQESRTNLEDSRIEIRTRSSYEDWMFLVEHIANAYDILASLYGVNKELLGSVLDEKMLKSTRDVIVSLDQSMGAIAETLNQKKVVSQAPDLYVALDKLQGELREFRQMRLAQKQPIEDPESFFVFFYTLKALAEKVLKIDSKVHQLYIGI